VRRGSIVRITVYGVLAGVLASLVSVLVPWLPTSASEEMDRIEFTFWFTTVICIAVFSVVAAAIVYSVLKFRVQPEDESDGPPIHGHTGLEIVWTAIPAVLVTAISVVSAIVLAKNDDTGPNPLRIAVTAQQFAWKFEYPGKSKVVSGELVLPVDRPVKLTLHSLDVIHSFWVPEFGQKMDAVPGIETAILVTPNRKGDFAVVCAELCGLGHATMRAKARVVERADFDAWIQENRQ
jgi:cytochrome c oxidase subunit II